MSDESGVIRKDLGGRLSVALVYPNTYFVGMSNLGLHTMYRVLNERPSIVCERFFTDHNRSVESSRYLSEFHVIAFSVSYELDWIDMVRILMQNGIPLRSKDRAGMPIVLAGGSAATINPEPVADALDLVFLGEGEPLAGALEAAFMKGADREAFMESLEPVPGVYIPDRTGPVYEGDAIKEFRGARPDLSVMEPFDDPGYSAVLTDRTVFSDMFLTEIARGCPYHCKFCTAREIYSPFRPVAAERLFPIFDRARASGRKLGLVSTSLNNHPELSLIIAGLAQRGLKIAPPSLRLGMISDDLLDYLEESRVSGVTLAPETGSESLRASLGKVVSNEGILHDVTALVSHGVRDIKLYFMVGLPGEEESDIDAVIDLVKRIRQVFIHVSRGNRRIGKVSLSVNTMVPKPHSRFERARMIEQPDARRRIKKIARGLQSQSNVNVSFEGPKWAYLQALIARGDRRVFDVLVLMAKQDPSRWQEVLKGWPRNPDYYAVRARDPEEVLPWDFYTMGGRGPCSPPGGAG